MTHSVDDEQAATLLLAGSVGVLPTDTVYGIVARAKDKQAVTRLYTLKRREHKPGTIIAASLEQIIDLGFNEQTLQHVSHLWPAPLSIVMPTTPDMAYLDQAVGSQPVRVPDDDRLRKILAISGPLVTSSANQPGEPTAETIEDAYGYFGDTVDFYVHGGTLSGRAPSTIIRVENGNIIILRDGAFKVVSEPVT